MLNVSMRILNDSQEAEDVLQESFISAFQKIEGFRGESSFGSWFKRIVINKSLNQLKRKKLVLEEIDERLHGEKVEEEDEHEEPAYTVQDIQKAMYRLPQGFRVVFSLYMFEDLSHREIAGQLGISESTSKSQLNRAKKKLKQLILEG